MLVNIPKTYAPLKPALVNLLDVPALQGYSFTLKTNTTVYLSLQVLEYGHDTLLRYIDNLVIPFNETNSNNVWAVKRFAMSDSAYLEIEFKISDCFGNFVGLGCNLCIDNFYTSLCNKYCLPVNGNYSCNTLGDKVCTEHKTGDNCEICQKEWVGVNCEECAENYFPEKVCNVTCLAVEGRYTCSDEGKKVCNEKRAGVECEVCAEKRTGTNCEDCIEGWRDNQEGVCYAGKYNGELWGV